MKIINSKGDLMEAVYTKEELRNIDSAIPMELWDKVNTTTHVMNYNDKGAFGELEDMLEVAKQRNIKIKCINTNLMYHNSK